MLVRLRHLVARGGGVVLQLTGLAAGATGLAMVLGFGWGLVAVGAGLFAVGVLLDNARST